MQAVTYLGDRLKNLLTRRVLTQHELANKAGVSINALNRIELSKSEPHMSALRKLARVLDVAPSELVGE
jgi:transcriptional regulator with XRE-family HTH domain